MRPSVVREILGEKAKYLSDIEIENIVSKFEYLAESLLDTYEKKIYQGKTMKQLLHNE